MKIPKSKAIELIDEKISQFEDILNKATLEKAKSRTLHDNEYRKAYYGAEEILTELFSRDVTEKFRRSVTSPIYVIGGKLEKDLQDFKRHIQSCIAQLEVYKEKIENFWPDDEIKEIPLPFISMSFNDEDKDINEYFTGILDALQIKYKDAKRYSKKEIPVKVKEIIEECDLVIAIFVKKYETTTGKSIPSEWLTKEYGYSWGKEMDMIALVEEGMGDIAGLLGEREIIQFNRDDLQKMQKATIKFLEALEEHHFV
jgi:hypothetical protein